MPEGVSPTVHIKTSPTPITETTMLVIGAGVAGIGMGIKLRQRGIPYIILEKAARLGGAWRDNTYPGCAVDNPSRGYSYSFERNPNWSRLYSEQAEILAYLERLH